MIHYHGSPLTPESAAASVFSGRHVMVSFAHPEQLPMIAEISQSFALDNGAFSAWRSGNPIKDWMPFRGWLEEWHRHPSFDWFLIPDVIDGDEHQNDELVYEFREFDDAVPVWHLHEDATRIHRLIEMGFKRIAIGSSGEYRDIDTKRWWQRMNECMKFFCDSQGRPLVRIHGLRMLDPQIFRRFPFASADSTNAARNVGLDSRWKGTYAPMSKAVRGLVLADRIEAYQSAAEWTPIPEQDNLFDWIRGEIQ
jgi:hypothetical protein